MEAALGGAVRMSSVVVRTRILIAQDCLPFPWSCRSCPMSRSLVILIFIISTSMSFLPERHGKFQTSLDRVFIGETVVFKCAITDDSLLANSSSIWIRRPNSITSIGRVVNQTATSAMIEVKMTSPSDAGTYYCTLSTPGGDFGLGSATVDVDYPLAAVTSLNCRTRSMQLICSYSLPRDYLHPQRIAGRVSYHGSEEAIDIGTSRNFSLPPGSDLYALYDFQVQLHYSGRNVTTASEVFHVNPMDVAMAAYQGSHKAQIMPKAVKGVVVRNTTARTLQLSWQPPDDAATYTYRVTCSVKWDNDEQLHIQTNLTQISLLSLSPSTNYIINVICRERLRQDGHWSDGSTITAKTLDAVPGRAPRVSPAISGTVDGRVILHWQPLSPGEENGQMQGYMVQCEDEEERRVGSGRFSMTLDIPSDRRGQWCNVSAVNNVGVSPTSSLYIPSWRPELTPREFWVAAGEDDTTFHWDLDGREQHNCAAYWCQAADTTSLCQTSVQWETVSCDQQNLTLDTGLVITDQHLMVGFSAQLSAPGGPVWSTIKWQHCIYAHNKVPPAPDGFRLSPSQPPLGVHVEWRSPDCRQNPARITSYLLSYCLVSGTADNCSGPRGNRVVSGDAISFLIRDLEPEAIYKVNIRAVSQVLRGPWSVPVIGRVEDELQPLRIVLPVSACLLLLVAILCGLLLKRVRRYLEQKEEFSYPAIRGMEDSAWLPRTESVTNSCRENERAPVSKSSRASVQCEVTEGPGSDVSDEKREVCTYTWSYGSTPNSSYSVVATAMCPDVPDQYIRHDVWGTTLGGRVTGTVVTDTDYFTKRKPFTSNASSPSSTVTKDTSSHPLMMHSSAKLSLLDKRLILHLNSFANLTVLNLRGQGMLAGHRLAQRSSWNLLEDLWTHAMSLV
ncbi:receptor-type tyrosine-protein phosphatase F-like [Haliotis asinina]|uniref:receptor-type tyrosine-protein phosphatase F-like n=1 Tax=Haliotis asinina TaxID=109174 RepID=UPI003532400E